MPQVNQRLILKNIRCTWLSLDEVNQNGKYSVQALMTNDPDDPQLKQLKRTINKVFIEKFGEDAKNNKKRYQMPLKKPDEEKLEKYAEYQGCLYFNASSANQPGVVNKYNEQIENIASEDDCYNGALFNISITVSSFESPPGKSFKPGVTIYLNNIMCTGNGGDRLDGRITAKDEFAAFAQKPEENFDDDIFGDDIDL